MLTDVVTTGPRDEDSTVLQMIVRRARSGPTESDTLMADGGYASAANSKAAALMGIDLVAPPRANTRRGKLSIEAFAIDFGRQVAKCPQGHESVAWREMGRGIQIRFDAKICAACPRRAECRLPRRLRSRILARSYSATIP